jgi:23S rRNA pseudouridine2457 synthase
MLIAFNKPYGVICQFSPSGDKPTLKHYLQIPNIYPAGRLDTDSEGLMLLTDDGRLQARIADPTHKLVKRYWVEVEGQVTERHLETICAPLDLGDFMAAPALDATTIPMPDIWPRVPPVRFRANIPTCWLAIAIAEGKNRQVRRMTAKAGLPTLRLVRVAIGRCKLLPLNLQPGEYREITPADIF